VTLLAIVHSWIGPIRPWRGPGEPRQGGVFGFAGRGAIAYGAEQEHASTGISSTELAGRRLQHRPIAAEIFGTLGVQGFNVELVVSTGGTRGTADICLAVAETQEADIRRALEKMKGDMLAGEIASDSSVALVSVTGQNLAKVPGVAGRMFRALSSKGINIEIISTSLASVTCMIPRDRTEEALAALEGEFLSERASG
jgi:aspartokinase